MKIKKYVSTPTKISYTVDCDGLTLNVVHVKNGPGHLSMTDIADFLWQVANSNPAEADMVECFVDFQSDLLLNGVSFKFGE
ncbi:hypothetical protein [Streptococcus suis]|uniref:hypothetical protein n=1 Tax=Streptococcus suis TaxID=1307 RepID=UPI000C1786EF|nr:hypothetical protein [Streptococcus suis]